MCTVTFCISPARKNMYNHLIIEVSLQVYHLFSKPALFYRSAAAGSIHYSRTKLTSERNCSWNDVWQWVQKSLHITLPRQPPYICLRTVHIISNLVNCFSVLVRYWIVIWSRLEGTWYWNESWMGLIKLDDLHLYYTGLVSFVGPISPWWAEDRAAPMEAKSRSKQHKQNINKSIIWYNVCESAYII